MPPAISSIQFSCSISPGLSDGLVVGLFTPYPQDTHYICRIPATACDPDPPKPQPVLQGADFSGTGWGYRGSVGSRHNVNMIIYFCRKNMTSNTKMAEGLS